MNKTIILIFFILLIISPSRSNASESQNFELNGTVYEYSRPTWKEPFVNILPSYKTFFERSFAKDNWSNLGIITASTIILYAYDRQILNRSQSLGRKLGIGNDDHTTPMITANNFNIFRGPTDWGSSLYFLGDGWTHTAILSGFLISGAATENNRAMQTGAEIFHGLLINTISNQFLKRITGRESPMVATTERGKWKPFPNQGDYGKAVPHYDAYPSGHVATSMMTFTVIRNNYPEYNSYLAPIQWTWISLLAFQMMNNGVHWASDYPLGIGMGYLFGQIASETGRRQVSTTGTENKQVYYLPIFNEEGATGLRVVTSF
jgi:membrane-associated phospholipid phosphatase